MNQNMSKTKIDWLKTEQEYLSDSKMSLADMARKCGISYSRLKKVSMERGWHEKKQELIEKGKQRVESEAEDTITKQIKQHRKDATYIKNTVLAEIKSRVEGGFLGNESLSVLVRLLDIGLRELRESFPKNLVIQERLSKPEEEGLSPELTEAVHDVLVFKLTRGSKSPSGQFDEARKKKWEENINDYINYKKDNGVNIENGLENC